MNFQATTKQRSYFHSLTGEWPRSSASKSEVSRLIKKALAGEITNQKDVIQVGLYRLTGTMAMMQEQHTGVPSPTHVEIRRNYYPISHPVFTQLAAAKLWAQAHFPDADIEVSTAVRGVYID